MPALFRCGLLLARGFGLFRFLVAWFRSAGFVVLCPPVPHEIPVAAVRRIVDRSQRGVLITTEMDNRLKDQEKMVMVFESGGIPIRFEVLPDIGHWYPDDLDDKIDTAIQFILSPRNGIPRRNAIPGRR